MVANKDSEASRTGRRIVQFIVTLSGIGFIIAGAILLVLFGSDRAEMMLIGIAFIVVGFGDLVIAFFVFRGVSESAIERPVDLDKREQIHD